MTLKPFPLNVNLEKPKEEYGLLMINLMEMQLFSGLALGLEHSRAKAWERVSALVFGILKDRLMGHYQEKNSDLTK